MRTTKETDNKVKDAIMQFLSNNQTQSTETIRYAIGRSWHLTLRLLNELLEENKVELFQVNQMKFWSLKQEQNK